MTEQQQDKKDFLEEFPKTFQEVYEKEFTWHGQDGAFYSFGFYHFQDNAPQFAILLGGDFVDSFSWECGNEDYYMKQAAEFYLQTLGF